ncbi:pyridoxamine 5'-phosphate oxidase family protein [Microbaculum marinum]|uniref:Pyridoxamine 5'-phosphate oxidase family protein n=1 Tax=Microbaculum marinum TaxID=1764581 RepID=A0AAW9RW62_9HYPH
MARIDTLESLRAVYGQPSKRVIDKQLSRLDPHCRTFISLSPFCVLATQGADGLGDATPRGEHPGFVAVLNDNTLALPDRPGNNRLDTLSNIIANPAVGILFMIPGFSETLRVNGTADIRDDEDLKARFPINGRLPATVLVVHVREAYLHCAKAFMRSKLWDPSSQVERSRMPPLGQIIKEQIADEAPAISEEQMQEIYARTMY